MRKFAFKHGPGLVDGLRVIASIGDKGSIQKLEGTLREGESHLWLGGATIVVRGALAVTLGNGLRHVMNRGDVFPSVAWQDVDALQEAVEDGTVLYCFRTQTEGPMWSRGFLLKPESSLQLAARSQPARCILVEGWARCNDAVDLSAKTAPHILKVGPNKPLSIVGEGVLLYMFEPTPDKVGKPAGDGDPLVDDYMKGLLMPGVDNR